MEHYIQTRGYAMAPEAPLMGDNVTEDRAKRKREGTEKQLKRLIGRNRDIRLYLDLIHHKIEHGGKNLWVHLCAYTSMCVGLFGLQT